MTALRMALSELRRLTAGRLPKLAVVALLLVPVLYGGLYLYANHDPYGRLNKIPTAVVVPSVLASAAMVGLVDEVFFHWLRHAWIGIGALAAFYAWALRKEGTPREAPPGSIGPASRAFAPRPRSVPH